MVGSLELGRTRILFEQPWCAIALWLGISYLTVMGCALLGSYVREVITSLMLNDVTCPFPNTEESGRRTTY